MESKVVKSVTKCPMNKASLVATSYKNVLKEGETYDVSAVRIKAVDEHGNTLDFATYPVKLTAVGPIEIIGPKLISLAGGMGGTYVKTVGQSGPASLILESPSLGEVKLHFEVVAEK